MSARRIFVGDVQGCREELQRLLDEVRFEPGVDRLYSVGDAVNRGPDSTGAVRLLKELDAVMVLGNHELHAFEVAAGRRRIGGRDTLEALFQADDHAELMEWLRTRPLLHLEDDLLMVHAGVSPAWVDLAAKAVELRERMDRILAGGDPEDPQVQIAVSLRYCDERGRMPERDWPPPAAPFVPWDEHYHGTRTVVFGHWARRGLVIGERVRGLDTGCVYGNQLTGWIAEEDRVVQVAAARVYCST